MYVTRLLWKTDDQPLCDEPLQDEDYAAIVATWAAYRLQWAEAASQGREGM
ncbi:MAG: hypothetical protein HY690_05525 [Chloroflexi bacterium]|nr:hypothetical protein [Chloroflexota bacterium]